MLRAIAASLALVLWAPLAHAVTVTPVHLEMTTTGGTGSRQVTFTNDSRGQIPVEVKIERLTLDENGERKLSKAGDEFVVFPPQAIIPAGASQVFRLQWVGDPEIKQSQSFIMTISQVPVKMPEGKSAVQVVFAFGVVVNVAPPNGKADLKVVAAGIETGKDGKRHPTLTVEDPTSMHALLPLYSVALSGNGWSHVMQPQEVGEKVGIGLVQPGKRRKFVIPIDLPASVTSIQANIVFKARR